MRPGDPGDAWGGRQGSEWENTFALTAGGAPVLLDGYGIRFTMRRWFDTAGDPLLQIVLGDPGVVVSDDSRSFTLTITADQMRALPSTLGLSPLEADLVIVPDGDEDRAFALVAGPFPVDPEVPAGE